MNKIRFGKFVKWTKYVEVNCYIPRDKLICWPLRSVFRVNHEEHVGEARAEVGAVRVVVPRWLGGVHVHALRTVQLNHGLAWSGRKLKTLIYGETFGNDCRSKAYLISMGYSMLGNFLFNLFKETYLNKQLRIFKVLKKDLKLKFWITKQKSPQSVDEFKTIRTENNNLVRFLFLTAFGHFISP